jgi:DNA-binding NarL/FixJ family response regulator
MGQTDATPGATYRVVVAEADPSLVALLRDQVTALGHTVVGESRHWSRALDLAVALRPDLLIVNLEMHDADLERLRALIAAQPALTVIGVAYDGFPDLDAAWATGMHHFLSRNFNLAELGEAMADAVAGSRGRG